MLKFQTHLFLLTKEEIRKLQLLIGLAVPKYVGCMTLGETYSANPWDP